MNYGDVERTEDNHNDIGENDEGKPILQDKGRYDSTEPQSNNKTPKSIWKDTDVQQKTIIIYISIMNYLNFLCYSTASPFLARVVVEKGGTVLLSTFVLQASMTTMAVFSIVTARYQTRIGPKLLIIAGQMMFALCQIGFGAIGYLPNSWAMVAFGIALRSIQGICQAALSVSGLTIVLQEFPDFVSTVFGLFEAAYGAGYLTGPYVGGFLYDVSGGMMAPMLFTGLLPLLFAFAAFCVLRKTDRWRSNDHTTSSGEMLRVLKNPRAFFIIFGASIAIGGFGLCDATLTVYLQPKGYSATDVGQILFLMGVSYCVTALSIGCITNTRKTLRRFVIFFGTLGVILFPCVWSPGQTKPWIYITSFGLGLCVALSFIPSYGELSHAVDSDGTASGDLSLNSALSGLWAAAWSICNFVVPALGSAMEMILPYAIAFTSSLLICYGLVLLMTGIIVVVQYQRAKKVSGP